MSFSLLGAGIDGTSLVSLQGNRPAHNIAIGEQLTMKNLNTTIKALTTATIFSLAANQAEAGTATFWLTKSTTNVVSLKLTNTTPVAGMQFTVNASSNIMLEPLTKSGRIQDGTWLVHQNRVNDSTINVLILNTAIVDLVTGEGTIAEFSFRERFSSGQPSRISLARVIVADPNAQSVPVEVLALEWTTVVAQLEEQPFQLEQNYPNPFNPSTTIRYKLQQPGQVRLSIFDITGREVMRVMDQFQVGGSYSVTWNGSDDAGRQVASGVYFAHLNVNGSSTTMRMTLSK
jgi:hypothetical protein